MFSNNNMENNNGSPKGVVEGSDASPRSSRRGIDLFKLKLRVD